MSLKNFLELFLLNIKVKIGDFFEYLRIISNYYPNIKFAKIDTYLIFSYLFKNPFAISKRFLLSRHAPDVHLYGETPLTTFEDIVKNCRLTAKDTVFELGCGRGRPCFWLNQFVGCSVVGVDFVPEFIKTAQHIQKKFDLQKIEFRCEDIVDTNLKGATFIYLYGSCFSDEFIKSLIKHFSTLAKGTKILTVSYPLTDYTKQPTFEVIKCFPARFTWGIADVFLQVKI